MTKNNNKIQDDSSYSAESLQEIDLLTRQLEKMAQEKKELGVQLEDHKEQLTSLKGEIEKLKVTKQVLRFDRVCLRCSSQNFQDELNEQNTLLRNRLRDVAHSPLSDNEKQQLLLDSHRHHSSAPASIATNVSTFLI